MDSGTWFPQGVLGPVQRRAADLSPRLGVANASAAGGVVACLAPPAGRYLCRSELPAMPAAVHSSVCTGMVRSSEPARRLCGLLSEFTTGHAGAAAMVHR